MHPMRKQKLCRWPLPAMRCRSSSRRPAEFQVYLASAGSYENAKESERDILLTDSYGFAQSKDLPYGLYVVHQTAGAEGQKFVPDFSVFISEHGKTYYFILNNPTFTSLIRFEKGTPNPARSSRWPAPP